MLKQKIDFAQVTRVNTPADTDIQYFLEVYPETKLQVLSIRGTANLQNAKEDAEYLPSKNQKLGIYVHRGFDEDAIKVYQDVIPHLNKTYKVRLTGHSLGAAIATLMMMYLYEDGFTIDNAINFGQPKVTNKVASRVAMEYWRNQISNLCCGLVPAVQCPAITMPRPRHYDKQRERKFSSLP